MTHPSPNTSQWPQISTEDISYRKHVPVLDTEMAYVDVGEGDPNRVPLRQPDPVLPLAQHHPLRPALGRCLAPDLVGMGNSGPAPDGGYRLVDQQRYIDAWFEAMGITDNVILVMHDWGSALGFDFAYRHLDNVKAIVYMESIVHPFHSWDEWPEATRGFFQAQRTGAGEDIILRKNLFIRWPPPNSSRHSWTHTREAAHDCQQSGAVLSRLVR